MRAGRLRAAVLGLLALLLLPFGAAAQDTRQYKLEAAFLYNFFNYITWPNVGSPEALKEVTICTEPQDPVADALTYVQRKMARQRTLTIRPWRAGESVKHCHLLFVRHAAPPRGGRVLTVTEGRNLDSGSMIALAPEEDRIGIRMNNTLLNRRGFTVSSRLLSLAQEVR